MKDGDGQPKAAENEKSQTAFSAVWLFLYFSLAADVLQHFTNILHGLGQSLHNFHKAVPSVL